MTDHDLADFLDAHANDMRAWPDDEPKFRLAAARLRHLDALLAELIAEAPTLIADLTAEVERLRAELDRRTDPALAAHLRCPTCGSEGLTICTNACRWPDDEPSPWLVIPNAAARLIDREAQT